MSIVRIPRTRSRAKWKVRWREGDKQRSRTFDRKEDAEAFNAKVLLAKRRGDVRELDAGRESFKTFTGTWWRLYGDDQLSPKTKVMYRDLLKRHLTPRLGTFELRQIDTLLVSRLQAEMLKSGVGRETTRKTLTILQGMLERAVEWGRIRTNPVRSVRKPSQRRQRDVQPIPPATVEALRRHLLDAGKLRDATLVSVLAYAGLRPGEALALIWAVIGKRTISVSKAISFGEESETKTGKARVVSLLKPLAEDLEEWRKANGRPNADALVFPRRAGGPWLDHDWRNWRKRIYVEAAKAVGIDSSRPYDLRHSLASLMFVEHRNPLEIAQMLGLTRRTLPNLRGRHARTSRCAPAVCHDSDREGSENLMFPACSPFARVGTEPKMLRAREGLFCKTF